MIDQDPRQARRESWRQTPERRLPGPAEAVAFIERVGIATLFPASPEVPNLFHAYLGDPDAPTDSKHGSPSGQVYAWRWKLGRAEAGFYSAIVRKRPTWVSWSLLPAVLRLRGELRDADELWRAGELPPNALRVYRALEDAGGVLSTGELRQAAGFPAGKAERAAYLKAVEELDTRLLLAKVFSPDEHDNEMRHALVATLYPKQVAAAWTLSRADAFDRLLRTYLPAASYAVPATLGRHLALPQAELREALARLERDDLVKPVSIEGEKGTCYLWIGEC